ncbi:MAG: hypothetical protein AAGI15_15940 [Pseudomonadota bacterium]
MTGQVAHHRGSFKGLQITEGSLSQRGCSLEFLAFLHEKATRKPQLLTALDPDLQQLLEYYRAFFRAKMG